MTLELPTRSQSNWDVPLNAALTQLDTTKVSKGELLLSVKDLGAIGDGVADDTSAIQATLTAASGKVAYIPSGIYSITSSLTLPFDASLVVSPKATIKANSIIAGAMLNIATLATWWENQYLQGGVWDCNSKAQTAINVVSGLNSVIRDVYWANPTSHGMLVGDPAATMSTHELHISRCKGWKTTGTAKIAGSNGIWVKSTAADNTIIDCVMVGPETSFRNDGSANAFVYCHGYGLGSNQFPTQVFYENGSDNIYSSCYADTPDTYGWFITSNAFRCAINGGTVFNNSSGPINTIIAIHTVLSNPNSLAIIGLNCIGTNAILQDYDGAWPSGMVTSFGNRPGSHPNSNHNVTNKVLSDSAMDFYYNRRFNYGAAPTAAAGLGIGTSPPAPVVVSGTTDHKGRITWGTGTATSAGDGVWVIFNRAYASIPTVVLTSQNSTTHDLGIYVRDKNVGGFLIGMRNAPGVSLANTTFEIAFVVEN